MDTFKAQSEFEAIYARKRQDVIRKDFPELNDQQILAVLKTQGPVRIVAGAGSGKTATLIARTANILKYGCASDTDLVPEDAEPDDLDVIEAYLDGDESMKQSAQLLSAYCPPSPYGVLVVTFTNKAAAEIRERLEAKIGPSGKLVRACTFHSLGLYLLRRFGPMAGIDPTFGICEESEQDKLIKSVKQAISRDNLVADMDMKPRELLNRIGKLKHALRTDPSIQRDGSKVPEPHRAADPEEAYVQAAYRLYQNTLNASRLMDFDDLILRTCDILNDPAIREACQNLFQYIMMDEYQDTDPVQDAIVRVLSEKHGNLCAVGDDDQSIYKFRGAEVDIFRTFDSYHPGCATIRLENNYRSRGHIIEGANAVIRFNRTRIGKTMQIVRETGNPVRVRRMKEQDDETAFVLQQINALVKHGYKYSDIAVLSRYWDYIRRFETGLVGKNIPYDIVDGTTFYKTMEIQDFIAYMRVAINPNDLIHMERIVPARLDGLGQTGWDRIKQAAAAAGTGAIDVMADKAVLASLKITKVGQDSCLDFARSVFLMNEIAHTKTAGEAASEILLLSGYDAYLEERAANAASDKADLEASRLENIGILIKTACQYHDEHAGEQEDTLLGFMDNLSLNETVHDKTCGAGREPGDKELRKRDAVQLMTAHRAKGLEFGIVFIIGAYDGQFPMPFDDMDIEEERRLFYVAMTRARDELFITCPREGPDRFRNYDRRSLSVFAEEIPRKNITIKSV